ncbi:MAG: B12-binding domain-containing radical SAM protein [Gammaproteobacteria bacterium]
MIINCYGHRHRRSAGSPHFIPQSTAAIALAGVLNRQTADAVVHCEFASGPLRHLAPLESADMLVLTGLNTAYDRMRQLSAYARHLNPGIPVVVGGPVARVLPSLCSRHFDIVCDGDTESLADVIHDHFGPGYTSEHPVPRFDLMGRSMYNVGYIEGTRNCNFRCSFCSMAAEGRRFKPLDLDFIRAQLDALDYRRCVIFQDQNLYGGPRQHFHQRMDLLQEYYDRGRFGGWAGLITEDFFNKDENLERARRSGCVGFYSGVETFSETQIAAFNKRQNLILPQERLIRRCLEAGIAFNYGLVFDPYERTIASLQDELDLIVNNPRITIPKFVSIAVPMLGSPLFRARLREGALLPKLQLLDMDGAALTTRGIDDEHALAQLARRLNHGPFKRLKLLRHAHGFARHYRRHMSGLAYAIGVANSLTMAAPRRASSHRDRHVPAARRERVYHASFAGVGDLYEPLIHLPEKYRTAFQPLHVTDAAGGLSKELWDDLGDSAPATRDDPHSDPAARAV